MVLLEKGAHLTCGDTESKIRLRDSQAEPLGATLQSGREILLLATQPDHGQELHAVLTGAFEGAGGASRDLMRVEPALISAEGVGKVSKSRSKMVVERLRVVPLSLNDFDQGGEAASCRRGQLAQRGLLVLLAFQDRHVDTLRSGHGITPVE